jgi:hypothetical protein
VYRVEGSIMEVSADYLGFLSFRERLDPPSYVGAVLITNEHGVPVEFRCTYPIRPTPIQKPLYGDALEPHIGVELCGRPLLASLDHSPSILLVDRDFLLDLQPLSSCPIVLVARAGEAIEVQMRSGDERTWIRRRVSSPAGRFQPIDVRAHQDREGELDVIVPKVESIFGHLDLLEPFDRIAQALIVLAAQDSRFQ